MSICVRVDRFARGGSASRKAAEPADATPRLGGMAAGRGWPPQPILALRGGDEKRSGNSGHATSKAQKATSRVESAVIFATNPLFGRINPFLSPEKSVFGT